MLSISATKGDALHSDHPFATVSTTAAERDAGTVAPERLAVIVGSLREHGAAVVHDAVDPVTCDRLCASMLGRTTEPQPVHWDEAQLWSDLPEWPPCWDLVPKPVD